MQTSQNIHTAIESFHSRMYVKELFDPIQTHAVYGVTRDTVPQVKLFLKQSCGATRFRVVKTRASDLVIVCFKLKENKVA